MSRHEEVEQVSENARPSNGSTNDAKSKSNKKKRKAADDDDTEEVDEPDKKRKKKKLKVNSATLKHTADSVCSSACLFTLTEIRMPRFDFAGDY